MAAMLAAQAIKKSDLWGGGGKPQTAVTSWIERACDPRTADADVVGILPELVAVINLQSTGPTEASRAVRKKLKYGDVRRQLRAVQVLESLVLNCGERFQTTFANEMLVDRIKIMAADPVTDATVKKRIMIMLASWHRTFASDPRMSLVAGLYSACGGGQAAKAREAKEAYQREQDRIAKEEQERRDRKQAEKVQKEEQKLKEQEEKRRRKMQPAQQQQQQQARRKFVLADEKPAVLAAVAGASQSANNLVNSIQHVNREETAILTDAKVQSYLAQTKEARRKVVRYTQLVPDQDVDGEFLGLLLNTNEQVMAALALYDRMSKPVELDSDEEADVERLAAAGKSRPDLAHPSALGRPATTTTEGPLVPTGDENDDDDEDGPVRAKMEAVNLYDSRIGEVAKLQDRQRRAIFRHNSMTQHPQTHAADDLAGLDFNASLPAPIEPSYGGSRTAGTGTGHATAPAGERGALSDFSDYDSSEEDDGPRPGHRPSWTTTATATAATVPTGGGHGRTYDTYLDQREREGIAHRGLLNDDDEVGFEGGDVDGVDPFADEFETTTGTGTGPAGAAHGRMEWAEV